MSEDNETMAEYERLRQRNIKQNIQMMIKLGILSERFSGREAQNSALSKPIQTKRSKNDSESSSTWSSKSSESSLPPSQRRRSKRLASLNPVKVEFTEDVARVILGDENCCIVFFDSDDESKSDEYNFDDDVFDLGKENARHKKRRTKHIENVFRAIPPVDDITEADLKRVCEIVSEKVYSQDGTTCHQCRQKTLDQKTYCRGKECIGIRGQFCGPCLKNRYGESVVQALKDPEWSCPPCRRLCNCSICRTQQGKLPTGQLYHMALERGFKSVRDFLEKEAEKEDENDN